MDVETQKLVKLKIAHQKLASLLQQIDSEINQTDIQWMHLKSLVPASHSAPPKGNASNLKTRAKASEFVKMEHHIDDQSVNETRLDLSLGNVQMGESHHEEDSD